jgi:TetR/AcrR family transcriptional regulator, lmrAB and yxaGH operons repressor
VTNDVRRRMVDEAAKSLARKGLQGTSFSEVLAASGAPRGSLYHHFPGGKDELVLSALDAASERALAALGERGGRPALDIAEGFVGIWRFILTRSDFTMGCAVAAVTVAAARPDQVARAGEIFRGWRTRLGELLAAGGVAPDRASSLAALLIAACEGAVILARADRSFEPFDAATGEALAAVSGAIGDIPPG